MGGISYLLLKLVPKNVFSRLLGMLADYPFPTPLLQSLITLYAHLFKIDLDEAKLPISGMKTFDQFFTRELRSECRPINDEVDSVVSPVDGKISEKGKIEDGLLLQTKGIYYSLEDLVGEKEAQTFADGFYVTIYLSPADYHRIHSPVQGKVNEFSYFSGNLWPVNQWGIRNIGSLFCINERILTPVESEKGRVGVIKVGATGVGKITLNFSKMASNKGFLTQLALPVLPPRELAKGEELGCFHIGSTVILLFEKGKFNPVNLSSGKKVRMGEKIGTMT